MTYGELWTSVYNFASLASGIEKELVIDGYDNTPASKMPIGNYCSVFIGEKKPYGYASINSKPVFDDENVQIAIMQEIVKNKKVNVQFNFYRKNSRDFADNMQTCFEIEDVLYFLRSNGLGISEIKNSVPLPALKSASYEQRSSISIVFFMKETKNQKVGIIKDVSIQLLTEHQNKDPKNELRY